MRSRTGSLPRSRWRSIERSSPAAPRPATCCLAGAEVVDEGGQRVVVRARLGRRGVEPAAQDGHGPMIVVRRRGTRPGTPPSSAAAMRRPDAPRSLSSRTSSARRLARSLSACSSSGPAASPARPARSSPWRPAAASASADRAARPRHRKGRDGSTPRPSRRTTSGRCPPRRSPRSTRSSRRPTSTSSRPPVHRAVPDRFRRAGVRLRVRAPGGVEQVASCEVEVDWGRRCSPRSAALSSYLPLPVP